MHPLIATIKWSLLYSPSCTTITTVWRHFHHPKKQNKILNIILINLFPNYCHSFIRHLPYAWIFAFQWSTGYYKNSIWRNDENKTKQCTSLENKWPCCATLIYHIFHSSVKRLRRRTLGWTRLVQSLDPPFTDFGRVSSICKMKTIIVPTSYVSYNN